MRPEWVHKYVGLPFATAGRGPAYDCWGLLRKVLQSEKGIELPSYGDDWVTDHQGHEAEAQKWEAIPAGQEKAFDVVLLRIGRFPRHVGIVVSPGYMLHIRKDINACIEKYRGPMWRQRIVGFYRR